MKGKIMAVAAVLVMVFAAVGVVMPQTGDADATATDLGTIVLPAGNSESGTKTINTTEGEFTGYAYTMTISASSNSSDWTELLKITSNGTDSTPTADTTAGTFTGSGFNLTIAKNTTPSVGSYTLTATTTGTDVTPTTVTIKAVIAPTVGGSSSNTQTIEYTVKVMDVNDESQTMYLNAMNSVTGGSYYVDQVEASTGGDSYNATNALTVANYTWYAYGLPEGLSMSSNGYISGIYTGSSTSASVTIVAMNSSEVYTGTLNLTMTAFSEGALTLTVKDGNTAVTGEASIVKTTSSTEMTLTLSATYGGESKTTDDGVKYSVIAVDGTGAVKDLYSSGDSVSIPLTGSGAYRIVVTATYTASGATYEATSSFYLYVMPVFESLSAHIAVSTS